MSSGDLIIKLPGVQVDGKFINGSLVSGKLQYVDVIYNGTFDQQGLLHGPDCSTTIGNLTYKGLYDHGEFKQGSTIRDDVIIESGEYTFVGQKKTPHLIRGKKTIDQMIYEGLFNSFGHLTVGKQMSVSGDVSYDGRFENGKMTSGIASYKLPNGVFNVQYRTSFDRELRRDLFDLCIVQFDGQIEDLPQKLLIMVCCDCPAATLAHKFFIKYLTKFDSCTVRYLKREMFTNLEPEEEAGFCLILDNLSKHMNRTTPTLKRTYATAGLSSGLESLVDVPARFSPQDF